MLMAEEVDVLSILTPSGFHADNVKDLAVWGKPIVVEKPMALRLNDADVVVDFFFNAFGFFGGAYK